VDAERTLVLLRHAKSDWSGGEPDRLRPLADRGRRQAPEAGRWLASQLPRLDRALVSPAERARRTWALASAELDVPPVAAYDERLYAASAAALLEVVHELVDDLHTVVLCGHNPGLEDLASRLAGEWVAMPTSALAVIDLAGPWHAAGPDRATLRAAGRSPADLPGQNG